MRQGGEAEAARKPVLLILASTYPRWAGDHEPGFVHELAKRLSNRFRVIALVPHAKDANVREYMDSVDVIRYRYAPAHIETLVNAGGVVGNLRRSRWKFLLLPGFVLAQAWRAWRLVRTEDVDVIHAHWLVPQGWIAAILQLLSGKKIPYLVTSHGADLYALRGSAMDRLKRFVVRHAAAVTVVSEAMRGNLARIVDAPKQIEVCPMGVDLSGRFSPEVGTPRSLDEILFVGRLVEKKGLRHLLDAMPLVLQACPSACLTVAGFGPEEGALKQQVVRLGLQQKVRFLGAVPQERLPALYRRAALFVAPFVQAQSGDQEGLGLVLVEAIGCGCPILAGNVPALVDVLGDGFEDMAIDPREPKMLAERIVALLTDSDGTQARASELRECIGERFDWAFVADQYASLLEKVV